jgi:lysophospholipase L1-like esterase
LSGKIDIGHWHRFYISTIDATRSTSANTLPLATTLEIPMRTLATFITFAIVVSISLGQPAKDEDRAAKWEKEIAAIEKRQAEKPPEKGGIVFAGSSTIRLWDLSKSFPDWKVTNSGFGGSEIRDSTIFADRLILKHEPRAIVFYAGDNDISGSRKPEQVLADFQAFAKHVHEKLPKSRIYFLSIKSSIARWKQFETQSKANALVKELCTKDERLIYVDMVTVTLGSDGQPKPEFFVKDGLHLSEEGYRAWTGAVKLVVK